MAINKTDPTSSLAQILRGAANYSDGGAYSISVNGAGSLSEWELVSGNVKEFEYYSGVEAGNPSGSTDNVENILYKKGATLVYTVTFEYNASDQVIKQEGTAA